MKSLLLKDFYNLKKNMKNQLISFLALFALAFYMGSPSYLLSILMMLSLNYCLLCFSYDEKNGFYSYALALPLSRKSLVWARYLTSYLIIGFMTLLALLINKFIIINYMDIEPGQSLVIIGALVGVLSIFISVLSPLNFKNGVEKSRFYIFLLVLIPIIPAKLALKYLGGVDPRLILIFCKFVLPILLLLINFISMALSLSIMEKKDF